MLSLCERAISQGQAVTVLAPAGSAIHAACAERHISSLAVDFTISPAAVSRLRRVLRDLAPSVVQGMSIFPVALIRRLRLLPVDGSVAYFAYVSTDPLSTLPVAAPRFRRGLLALRNAISRAEAPHLDAIFAASATIARRLAQAGIRGRIVEIPGVVDVAALEVAAAAPPTTPLPPGAPRIGYAAFLEPLKGIDDLVAAFALVAREHPGATLLIAGTGPQLTSLEAQAATLGVADRVQFLGYVDPVAPFLAALHVYVSPSHSEALGISIMEAMALRRPCVVTRAGGIADALVDGDDALLVAPGDSRAMAAAISRLLADPELAARVADGGHRVVTASRYALGTTLATVEAEYADAAGRAAGGRR
jgi:glycosyltransferase involved in cell wall biosynthesis